MVVGRDRNVLWIPAPADNGEPVPVVLQVLPARDAPVCKEKEQYLIDLEKFQKQRGDHEPKPKLRPSMRDLLDEKEFCGSASAYSAVKTRNGTISNLNQATAIGNPENPYGRWWTGIGMAYRFDRGGGGSIIIPAALSLPFVGGWMVGKVNLPLDRTFLTGRPRRPSSLG